jgi:N-acetylglucosaminyldiphosphoundecaprenol N-acetyl-beta-D-mannosaminyltransferase
MTIASPDGIATGRPLPPVPSRDILGMRVDATSYEDATARVLAWAGQGRGRTVAVATVNNVMEAHDDPSFLHVMNDADLVTPDGMPLVWGLRLLGVPSATRVYGPDLTPIVLRAAEREGVPVGFHGSAPEVLGQLLDHVRATYPALDVVYAVSPPFGQTDPDADRRTVEEIRASGCRILFVGLGCPKQERWMAEHRATVPAVMLGVGAAFDFLAGTKRQAPRLLQRLGLEWLFRLLSEPRRLWRRYLRHNPRFVALFGLQVLRARLGRRSERPTEQNGGSRE